MQPTSALTASAIGLLSTSAAAYLRSALSKNCCWMRCSSMVTHDKTRISRVGSAGVESRPQPFDPLRLDADDVEAARRQDGEAAQIVLGGEDQPALLGVADAGSRT